jgi:hypothetical protein
MRGTRIVTRKSRLVFLALTALLPLGGFASQASAGDGGFIPTGKQITPTAATGSTFQPLNPELPGHPDFTAGQAVTTATSPDGKTLLILTSGYNSQNDAAGNTDPAQSNEYVLVYDISGGAFYLFEDLSYGARHGEEPGSRRRLVELPGVHRRAAGYLSVRAARGSASSFKTRRQARDERL